MNDEKELAALLSLCDEHSVLVVEDIWRNPTGWKSLQDDERVSTSFDLYYCGILLFQKKRYKSHYIINF
jgi:hypothetical protein